MDHFRARPLVVVLDDDEGLLELMAAILEDEGYAVEGRRQWQGALKLVRQVRPDVVILDVVFGREPIGWHVLEALKAHPDTTAACFRSRRAASRRYCAARPWVWARPQPPSCHCRHVLAHRP